MRETHMMSRYFLGSLLVILALQIETARSQFTASLCHIPTGNPSAEENRDSLRFTVSTIQNNVDFILPALSVVNQTYFISSCKPTLLVVSQPIRNPSDLLLNAGIENTRFRCGEILESSETGTGDVFGRVLKFVRNPPSLPEYVPTSWNSGYNIILELRFSGGIPSDQSATYQCRLQKQIVSSITIDVMVSAEIEVEKIGCPDNLYGEKCNQNCACKNGGQCHTFEGWCICPNGTEGVFCETDNRPATIRPSTITTQTERITETSPSDNDVQDGGNGTAPLTTSISWLKLSLYILPVLNMFVTWVR